MATLSKHKQRIRRHLRVRAKVRGTADRPRLSLFRSNQHLWIQLVDDEMGHTLVAASEHEGTGKDKKEKGLVLAEKLGETVARVAFARHITAAVFDRGGYKYHGLVKAVASGARKGGLTF